MADELTLCHNAAIISCGKNPAKAEQCSEREVYSEPNYTPMGSFLVAAITQCNQCLLQSYTLKAEKL